MGEARASTGRGADRARVSLVCVCQLEHPQLSIATPAPAGEGPSDVAPDERAISVWR